MISSSAVAKRPRDASCLSVVSFNSTKRRVESFLVSYAGYIFLSFSFFSSGQTAVKLSGAEAADRAQCAAPD